MKSMSHAWKQMSPSQKEDYRTGPVSYATAELEEPEGIPCNLTPFGLGDAHSPIGLEKAEQLTTSLRMLNKEWVKLVGPWLRLRF